MRGKTVSFPYDRSDVCSMTTGCGDGVLLPARGNSCTTSSYSALWEICGALEHPVLGTPSRNCGGVQRQSRHLLPYQIQRRRAAVDGHDFLLSGSRVRIRNSAARAMCPVAEPLQCRAVDDGWRSRPSSSSGHRIALRDAVTRTSGASSSAKARVSRQGGLAVLYDKYPRNGRAA